MVTVAVGKGWTTDSLREMTFALQLYPAPGVACGQRRWQLGTALDHTHPLFVSLSLCLSLCLSVCLSLSLSLFLTLSFSLSRQMRQRSSPAIWQLRSQKRRRPLLRIAGVHYLVLWYFLLLSDRLEHGGSLFYGSQGSISNPKSHTPNPEPLCAQKWRRPLLQIAGVSDPVL